MARNGFSYRCAFEHGRQRLARDRFRPRAPGGWIDQPLTGTSRSRPGESSLAADLDTASPGSLPGSVVDTGFPGRFALGAWSPALSPGPFPAALPGGRPASRLFFGRAPRPAWEEDLSRRSLPGASRQPSSRVRFRPKVPSSPPPRLPKRRRLRTAAAEASSSSGLQLRKRRRLWTARRGWPARSIPQSARFLQAMSTPSRTASRGESHPLRPGRRPRCAPARVRGSSAGKQVNAFQFGRGNL
jgi:hypothetical protein